MDEEWAIARLREFAELTRRVPSGNGYMTHVGRDSAIITSAQVCEQILVRVLPSWRVAIPPDLRGWKQHHEAAIRAIAELETRAVLAEKLGDDAPAMNASAMHPWIWASARSLWQSRHYREAVRAAAVKVNAELQNKTGRRDIAEQQLFQQAFSNDPPTTGKPRLRPPADDGGQTALSLRRGIVAFAEGCYAAIRNPASHDEGELREQEALEQLAAFSVLSRWVDGATVETAE